MTYFWDRFERNESHERGEDRAARRYASGECRQHTMKPTRSGGGICTTCGMSVDREEL